VQPNHEPATNTVVAAINNVGLTEIIPDREGNRLIPTAVFFDDQRTAVGEAAYLWSRGRPGRLVTLVKREMGGSVYSRPIEGIQLPPQVIQACLLNQVRLDVSKRLGSNLAVVITVPAHFNEVQRQATAEAGEMAGLHVLEVLTEPVAAALAFGEAGGYLYQALARENANVLVFDLGGFTCKATVIAMGDRSFRVLSTEYKSALGGRDFDARIARYLAEVLKQEHGMELDDAARYRLVDRARKAKHVLAMRPATKIRIEHGGKSVEIPITRELFAKETEDLTKAATDVSRRALHAAKLDWKDVRRVLLVGGATRMPSLREKLQSLSGAEPDYSMNPEEAVARGAALQAANLLVSGNGAQAAPKFHITNVTTHSLGIEGIDAKTGQKSNTIVIPKGTPLPVRVSKDFATKANAQKTIAIHVLEGESTDPRECMLIGKAIIRDLPETITDEWPIEVVYEYLANGRLNIEAHLRYTDHAVHLELVRPASVSRMHLQRWKQVITAGSGLTMLRAIVEQQKREHHPPPIATSESGNDQRPEEKHGLYSRIKGIGSKLLHPGREPDAESDAGDDLPSTARNTEEG